LVRIIAVGAVSGSIQLLSALDAVTGSFLFLRSRLLDLLVVFPATSGLNHLLLYLFSLSFSHHLIAANSHLLTRIVLGHSYDVSRIYRDFQETSPGEPLSIGPGRDMEPMTTGPVRVLVYLVPGHRDDRTNTVVKGSGARIGPVVADLLVGQKPSIGKDRMVIRFEAGEESVHSSKAGVLLKSLPELSEVVKRESFAHEGHHSVCQSAVNFLVLDVQLIPAKLTKAPCIAPDLPRKVYKSRDRIPVLALDRFLDGGVID